MAKRITLSQACEGMLFYKTAVGKSPHTIADYRISFKKLQAFIKGDPPFASITRDKLVAFFAWLQNDYVSEPDGVAPRGKIKLSPKSILNVHTNLSALWGWAVNEGYVEKNIVRTIEPPKVQEPIIEPFTKEEVQALLKACDVSRTWKNRSTTTNTRPTADRDRAIILTLLDSGIRASELCGIRKADLDLTSNSIKVIGKGNKPRLVQIGRRTSQAIWKAMLSRLESMRDDDPVFAVGTNGNERPLTRFHLLTLLERLGERAGVKSVYPHRFRHSFAISYLRNGGDVFTLQQLLGHSELAMVRRYARIAQTDCAVVHQRASPVDNWRL